MHFSTFIPAILLLPYTTQALTYWLDKSCVPGKPLEAPNSTPVSGDGTHRWDVLFDELRAVGKSSRDRLTNARRDPDFTRAFNAIFRQDTLNFNNGVDQDGQAALALRKYFMALEGMRHEEVQVNADLRFYCDNDARWVQKTGDGETGWKDTENHLSTPKCYCKDAGVSAITYIDYPGQDRLAVQPGTPKTNHNPNRATITLCDHAFNKVDAQADPRSNKLARYLFSDIPENFDYVDVHLNPRPIDFITSTFTALLLHEISHTRPFLTKDQFGDDSYGWHHVAEDVEVDVARKNAESFMYLAIISMFQDRNFVLDRRAPANGDLDREDDVYKPTA
ncbi:hypothetical protein BHYA_0136g00310 [Botrytis hyacinthi]|uniref:Lysine-specific metallo-endopeptidase domain-containing protein n=1 Tax=Botrytis hyacinthi TaxID=278943 RepID=A0A4Z1GIU9_9HELO|nr:hypothetical protein BHYA_0136g00310 [Botrytis hyacinthi]